MVMSAFCSYIMLVSCYVVSCVRCRFYMYLSMSTHFATKKTLGKVIIEMSVSGLTLLDNINRVARL